MHPTLPAHSDRTRQVCPLPKLPPQSHHLSTEDAPSGTPAVASWEPGNALAQQDVEVGSTTQRAGEANQS